MRRREFLLLAATGSAAACSSTVLPPQGGGRGRVMLLRGLANVFSTGMDSLAQRIADAGYRAEVHNHTDWMVLAAQAVEKARAGSLPRPFAVVGHSLGADDAIRLVEAIGAEGVPTDLLVTFDPVFLATVSRGPHRVLNFYNTGGFWGRALEPAPNLDGRIENIPVDGGVLDHFDIDKNPALHEQVVAALDAIALAP